MKKFAILLAMITFFFVATPASAQTIDGTIGVGEWDSSFLGTSVTGWSGGMSVDVYGYADSTNLYAAYVADTSQAGWAVTQALCIGPNLYYKTPTTISWPDPGYTIVGFFGDGYGRTDGSDWTWPDGYGNGDWPGRGIEFVVGHPCGWSTVGTPSHTPGPNANVAEIKIPLSQLTYASDDGQILLGGQYWQYDGATPFPVDLQPEDSDSDGVTDDVDFCPNTNPDEPDARLGTNRWIWDGSNWTTQLPEGKEKNGKASNKSYSIEDTEGCGCSQILTWLNENFPDDYGELNGHWKFGCSQSILEDFMVLISFGVGV